MQFCFFYRYDEMSSKFNVEYIAGGISSFLFFLSILLKLDKEVMIFSLFIPFQVLLRTLSKWLRYILLPSSCAFFLVCVNNC